MEKIFDAPPEGAVQSSRPPALKVSYKANKIEPKFFGSILDTAHYVQQGHLGFFAWDGEKKQKLALEKFTFIVLEVYSGVSGQDGQQNRYWSNRVLDTRLEEMIVWRTGHDGPLLRGIYKENIKPNLPPGPTYKKYIKAFCLDLDRLVEIEVTSTLEKGMQKAIAAADILVGRKTDWEKVNILSLAKNDHIWGFSLIGYDRETAKGAPHTLTPGEGNLFFTPRFHAGVVLPANRPEIWNKYVALQREERELHESYTLQNKRQVPAASVEDTGKKDILGTGPEAQGFSRNEPDDLPF